MGRPCVVERLGRWYGTSVVAELAAQASALQEGADQLLEESGLLDLLHQVGDVRIKGAYAYGVMLDPDIDIEVVVPHGRERSAAVALLESLIHQNYWNGYLFYDHREKRSPRPQHSGVPRAYYVGVKAPHDGHWWEVDVWVGDSETLRPVDDWVRQGLGASAREIVLSLKHARTVGQISASGLAIYTAVLKHQVATVEQFLAWQRERAPDQ